MSFVYPLGLLGLIGIPILIIIYIIKNKYTEQTIPSVYIWKLSERFLKRKKPISKLQGLISLILQCLTILCLSLLIAEPSIVVKGGAKDYCFILDGSGSMMSQYEDSTTRFDYAKKKIEDYIDSSSSGSAYSLIYSGSDTHIVYQDITSKDKAKSMLEDLTCSNVAQTLDKSIEEAQKLFNDNTNLKFYLFTDQNYNVNENIELINLSTTYANYSILSSEYKLTEEVRNADQTIATHAKLSVFGNIKAYNESKTIELELLVDGVSKSVIALNTKSNEETSYSFEVEDITTFNNYEVRIKDTDSLSLDNSYVVYNTVLEHNYKALVVSNKPFYFQAILESYGKIEDITAITLEEYNNFSYTGYGLYIFDSESYPENLPTDGTIWIFNAKESIKESGFTYLNSTNSKSGYTLEKETVYGEEKSFLEGYIDSDSYKMTVLDYNQYSISKNFKTLFSIDSYPAIFVGNTTNASSNREIVFAFSIRESNLAMNYNALLLFNKLLDYSFPTAINTNSSVAGNEFSYNVISGTKNIKLYSPSNTSSYLDISNSTGTVILSEVGTYIFEINQDNNVSKRISVYNSFPQSELEVSENLSLSIEGEQTNNYRNSYISLVYALFVIVLLLFVADWMVYCYEQHQLF